MSDQLVTYLRNTLGYTEGADAQQIADEILALPEIADLHKPFILTDTPPSEPGWYVTLFPDGTCMPCLQRNDGFIEQGAKWGSAPLPLLGGEDNG